MAIRGCFFLREVAVPGARRALKDTDTPVPNALRVSSVVGAPPYGQVSMRSWALDCFKLGGSDV